MGEGRKNSWITRVAQHASSGRQLILLICWQATSYHETTPRLIFPLFVDSMSIPSPPPNSFTPKRPNLMAHPSRTKLFLRPRGTASRTGSGAKSPGVSRISWCATAYLSSCMSKRCVGSDSGGSQAEFRIQAKKKYKLSGGSSRHLWSVKRLRTVAVLQ